MAANILNSTAISITWDTTAASKYVESGPRWGRNDHPAHPHVPLHAGDDAPPHARAPTPRPTRARAPTRATTPRPTRARAPRSNDADFRQRDRLYYQRSPLPLRYDALTHSELRTLNSGGWGARFAEADAALDRA